ncbi:SDR family oxidoreductase [Kribbella italica]|uniref:NAD(P)-dependent dehydrogenase (Short-subunit alcohol dehydrogenase family) n=1 Tax=Kribbella italica TaxID=1540520 RepID=A0A7W9JAE4_9ACTN|nr:NAD(P)-dependent dehydrogenase (short-subunit alcohol dehydrogenase family) [Kribbella italica]
MKRFEGKVAFVTGAAHGIGRATAVRLAAEGASVAVADVDLAAAEQVVAELGVPGIAVECDITSRASVDAAVAATVERFGRLDVLVQVAGHNLANREAVEPGDAQWTKQYDFTFTGAVRCIEAALPHLVPTEGAVVLIGSISGVVALGTNPYAAAKAALSSLVRNLAADHGPSGVRFNIVAPATVATRAFKDPQVLEELKAIYPLRRVGQPDDVAAAVAFLASADAAWITGITLPVEGGLTTGPGHLIS